MKTIDGSLGGGQMVRTALALSTLTNEPFRINSIRTTRPQPGLKPQHLTCIKALKEFCNAKADGDQLKSTELLYIPGDIKAKNLTIDIQTAGSITLLLQSILLPSMFANKTHTITIKGGTDTKWSMPIDYFNNVLLPQYRRAAGIQLTILNRGYYPKGGGEIKLRIEPDIIRNEFDSFEAFQKALTHKRFTLKHKGHLISIKGISHASENLAEREVAERQALAAEHKLKHLGVPINIEIQYAKTLSSGSGITLWAIHSLNKHDIDPANPIRIGADALGEQGKPSEHVGEEAATKLLTELNSNAPVDKHLADNLIPLIGLCRPSTIHTTEITQHARTNIHTAKTFLGNVYQQKQNTITTTKEPITD